MQHLRHGLHGVPFIIIVQKMRQHFRIRLRHESIPLVRQHPAQLNIILDNAVMYHRDRLVRIEMRMRIDITRYAMGRPPGMPDAAEPCHRLAAMGQIFQNLQPAHGLGDVDLLTVIDGHACRIISPVLQPGQTVQDNRSRLFCPDISYNSAHIDTSLSQPFIITASRWLYFFYPMTSIPYCLTF